MSRVEISQQDNQVKLAGVLNFQSVAELLSVEHAWLKSGNIDINLAEISQSNSAGLALLLEWMKMAKQKGLQIKYHSVPEQLLSIARAYGVDQELPLAV